MWVYWLLILTTVHGVCPVADEVFWRQEGGFFQFAEILVECYLVGTRNIARDNVLLCFEKLLPEFSAFCTDCSKTLADCLIENCLEECGQCNTVRLCSEEAGEGCTPECILPSDTTFSDECEECKISSCTNGFELCTGFALDTCNGCINPLDDDPSSVFLLVGAIGGCLLLVPVFILYKRKVETEKARKFREKFIDKKEPISIPEPMSPMSAVVQHTPERPASIVSSVIEFREKLEPPPGLDRRRYFVTQTFEALNDDEINVLAGDEVEEVEVIDENWVLVEKQGTGKITTNDTIGIVPRNCLALKYHISV